MNLVPFPGARRPSSVHALLLGLLAFAHVACSADATTTPVSSGPEATEPTEAAAETPDPAAEACAAETAELQAGLDKAHAKTSDAVLAVKTPSCGLRVLTSGPSKLDGTELHRIGSVTKTYVAAAILELAKDGKLGLDDAVSKWVEDVPGGDAIIIRQLLNHTSGLFDYTSAPGFQEAAFLEGRGYSPRELLEIGFARSPAFEPGKRFGYSNTNYVLLGLIAEKAGGAKLGAVIRARVLDRIGAKHTFLEGDEPVDGTIVMGRSSGVDTKALDMSWAWAAGATVATAADVVTWTEQRGSGAFHGPERIELSDAVPFHSPGIEYALGVLILDPTTTGGVGVAYGHTGGLPGARTQAFYFPDKQTTFVSFLASDEDPGEIGAVVHRVLFAKR